MTRLRVTLASWAPFLAGAEVAAERLGIGLRDAGHDVLMIVGTDGEALARYRDAGLRCQFVPMQTTDKRTFWRTVRMRKQFVRVLLRERPDVVHSNDLPTAQMVGWSARRLGLPHVCHHRWVFGATAIDWLNKYGADRHVFVSQYLMDELCSESSTLTSAPCSVVYDGLPLSTPPDERDRRQAREELRLPLDKVIVLLAGQVIERKGVADAVHAWNALPNDRGRQAELHVVGEDLEGNGAYRLRMEKLASQLNVAATFHGFRRDVPKWLAACDVVLVPSHVEPLGNATLEAMAAGRPVIAANVGGIPEMVVNDETGILVRPKSPRDLADAVQRVLDDAEMRRRMGQAARTRCEGTFSIEAHVKAVVSEYVAILENTMAAC